MAPYRRGHVLSSMMSSLFTIYSRDIQLEYGSKIENFIFFASVVEASETQKLVQQAQGRPIGTDQTNKIKMEGVYELLWGKCPIASALYPAGAEKLGHQPSPCR